MKEMIGLQYLRGVAAMGVVIYHFMPRLVEGGYVLPKLGVELLSAGVDVFFVISGYIIWLSTQKPGLRAWPWWKARLIRIVPLYWLALTAALLLSFYDEGGPYGLLETLHSYLFIPTHNSHTHEFAPILVPGWTLNYEFMFYGCLASVLFIRRPWLRLAVLCVGFASMVVLRRYADLEDAIQFRLTSPMMFEFVAGIAIAVVGQHIDRWRIKPLLGWTSLACCVAAAAVITPRLLPDGPRVIYFGVPAGFLVFGVVCLEDLLRRRVIKFLRALGDASYSLYLSHLMTVVAVLWILRLAHIDAAEAKFAGSVLVTTLAGLLIYRWVELPVLGWLRGQRRTQRDLPQAARA